MNGLRSPSLTEPHAIAGSQPEDYHPAIHLLQRWVESPPSRRGQCKPSFPLGRISGHARAALAAVRPLVL